MFGYNRLSIHDFSPFVQAAVAKSKLLSRVTGNVFWGLNGLDRELVQIIGTSKGFFVELGANNGLNQSNTKHLELFHNWSGILIEPHPGNFGLLARNRSHRSVFVNAACVSADYRKSTLDLLYSNLMTTPLEVESDIENREDHAQSGEAFLARGESVHKFSAPAITLTRVLEQRKAPLQMDLLSLDVEGAELEVLKGLNHEKYRFEWLLVETRNLLPLSSFLAEHGYSIYSKLSGHDYLFRSNSVQS
jgi:FkbM family methyltransferase